MSKAARWAVAIAVVAFVGIALVLGFVLALTSDARAFYERNFTWLLWLNVAVAMLLGLVIAFAAIRLALRIKQRKFGSNLLLKLAGIFALVGVLPGVLIYTVSFQFVSRSIEIWFDERVEGALDAGLALGRGTIEVLKSDLVLKTRGSAERLGDTRSALIPIALERLREQLSAQEVTLLGAQGQVLLTAGGSQSINTERPSMALVRQARSQRVSSSIEGLEDDASPKAATQARMRALAIVPSTDIAFGSEDRFLMVVQAIPPSVASNALEVQAAYREYQQRAVGRSGLRKMYIGTLTLALVLAVFGAVLLAVLLGNQLAKPLLLLAEGMKQVAAGDLTAKPVSVSRDEIGGLTRSFAVMTEQLGQAREQVQRGVAQMESARTRLQTILDSLSAGVIVLGAGDRIDTVNPGATRILKLPMSAYVGWSVHDVQGLEPLADAAKRRFELHATSPEAGERDHWQDSMEIKTAPDHETLTLLMRGATLPGEARLLVFDDITEVVSAQRSAAWSEVARRLAHEIKNPLTPIQLSAERLQMKLEGKLQGVDQSLLNRSVSTIVTQVQAMKQLVDEFRDYARLPAAKLEPLDLNALAHEVLALYGQPIEHGRLKAELEPHMPRILGDATQLRQVIHNLVQNALDAVGEREHGLVQLQTQTARGEDGGVRAVRLNVLDNGGGFPDKVLKRAFEPYVTTKTKGTGLGLAVVKKIADEHGARVRIGNRPAPTAEGLLEGLDSALEAPRGASPVPGPVGAQVSLSFSKLELLGDPLAPDPTQLTLPLPSSNLH
jgi:nitrogen fixation/metabolism regulation signal transduction histidine kinase